jgi:hypothetical protein
MSSSDRESEKLSAPVIEEKVVEHLKVKNRVEILECLKTQQRRKLKSMMKLLQLETEENKITGKVCEEVMELFQNWLTQEKAEDYIVVLAKAFYNWLDKLQENNKTLKGKMARIVIEMTTWNEMLTDLDKQRVLKRLLLLATAKLGADGFVAQWSSILLLRKAKVESEVLCQWIMDWSKKGEPDSKQAWVCPKGEVYS